MALPDAALVIRAAGEVGFDRAAVETASAVADALLIAFLVHCSSIPALFSGASLAQTAAALLCLT